MTGFHLSDCLLLLVYKDRSERLKGLKERSSITLEDICGLDPGLCYEGLNHTLAIICLTQVVMLGFENKETMQAWDVRIRYSLGEGAGWHSQPFAPKAKNDGVSWLMAALWECALSGSWGPAAKPPAPNEPVADPPLVSFAPTLDPHRLAAFQSALHEITSDFRVLSIVTKGYKLQFQYRPPLGPSATGNVWPSELLFPTAQELLSKGAILAIPCTDLGRGFYSR
ncbi:UNVERIFIED_CONTAM: hypothetical protein K2H54_060531 [Gekko kuhli]